MKYAEFELIPKDGRKSFYRKAYELFDERGNVFLRSYDTIVAMIDNTGKFHRFWSGYSATTMRHINAFLGYCTQFKGISKSEWLSLPIENLAEWQS